MAPPNGSTGGSDLAQRKYIRYDSGVEKIPPNEAEDIQAVAETINRAQVSWQAFRWPCFVKIAQKAMFNKTRHGYTGTHARTQGVIKGKLVVADDLPKHLKQSLFEKSGEYDVVA